MNKKKNKIKSDYQAKDLKNPFFYRSNSSRVGAGNRWWLLLIFMFLGGLVWFLFSAPFFIIDKIEITGLERINNQEIESITEDQMNNRVYLFFSQNNFFLFNKEKLSEEISKKYNFSNLSITKNIPNKLTIEIGERPYAFIFQEGSDLYYASRDGYIIKDEPVSEEAKENYFTLENKSKMVSINSNGKINLKANYFEFIFNLVNSLAEYQDLRPERYIVEQELNSLIVDFLEGPIVYFNIEKDPKAQVDDLALVKKLKIRDNFNTTNYIDLRYGEMIYIN